jgi:putative nucleotidyltransferase with HDIG domain
MGERRIRLRAVGPDSNVTWEAERLLRIGRLEDFEVLLHDSSISRRHAQVEFTELGWVVRDLGSTNGTFLNGVRAGRTDQRIRERDLLQCGNIVLVVEQLSEEPLDLTETPCGTLQVQATTRQSLQEAAQVLALDVTRSNRPGEQLLNLLRAGQHLHAFDSLDELLRLNLQDTATALKARRGAVVLIDPGAGKFKVRAIHDTKSDADGTRRCFSQTLAARCFRGGQSLLCADIHDDPELLRTASVTASPMSSIICALLRSPRQPLGVLHLDRGPSDTPFTREDLHLADALAANMSSSIESAQILQERQRVIFIQTVLAFSGAIELRDQYTGGHTQRVTDYSLLLAEEMGLSEGDTYSLRIGAPLHDIGKIGVDDAVLRKRTRLTPSEYEHMKSHTTKGAAIVEMIPGLEAIVPIVRNHHERWDGTGYPDRFAGEGIPRLARMVAVADTFDAMTTDRPYRAGLAPREAFAQIEEGAGVQFDPECAHAFVRLRPLIESRFEQQQSVSLTQQFGERFDPQTFAERPVRPGRELLAVG